jgi:hypothetical protein
VFFPVEIERGVTKSDTFLTYYWDREIFGKKPQFSPGVQAASRGKHHFSENVKNSAFSDKLVHFSLFQNLL